MAANKNAGDNREIMKLKNRCLVLKLICTEIGITRGDISSMTGLTKMTMSNIISDLINANIVEESGSPADISALGRKPKTLDIGGNSPCVFGVYIGRGFLTAAIYDLKARALRQETVNYPDRMTGRRLVPLILDAYNRMSPGFCRKLLGVGLASVGPLNTQKGMLLAPPNFYGVENLPLTGPIAEATGLPVCLMNDASASALAENLYGNGKGRSDFLYLHLYNGIGSGMVLDGKLYEGNTGSGGEIGHSSINFNGPVCNCGNRGCLELYANESAVIDKARELLLAGRESLLNPDENLSWDAVVSAADKGDVLASAALEDFCEYISYALHNYLSLFDIDTILLGYRGNHGGSALEQLLEDKTNARFSAIGRRKVRVHGTRFGHMAPSVGSAAILTSGVFSGEIPCGLAL